MPMETGEPGRGPGAVVDHDLAGASVAAQDRLTAVNDVRTTLLQAVGGVVVLFGAYATWRQLCVSQDGLRATQEGYVTDRFSTAVDQLGSDKLETGRPVSTSHQG
ncbi:hypothetical protein [Streptomyces sp. CRN 30]|uniref:hypothetical protein n=1 Tax=Streptomyces sp. CRN 30 TaxID=3075613 RepID=UPI002A8348A7|nr:hypothetical protein [Streptomyces sp. CRN 30]